MSNLLPENLRDKIKKEYKLRLVIVSIIIVIIIQISLIIFMIPSWLSSFYKEKDFSLKNEEMSQFLSTLDIASTTSYIKLVNTKLATIDKSLDYPKLVPIIDNVLSKKTSGIKIDGIYFTVNSENTAVLNINGIGSTRESIVSFAEKLRETSYFKNVNLPISNLAKDKNIDFAISLNIEK